MANDNQHTLRTLQYRARCCFVFISGMVHGDSIYVLRIISNHTLRKQANWALCYFGMFVIIHGGSIDVLRIITNYTLRTIECTGQCSIVVLLIVVRMHGCYIDGLRILNHHTVMTLDLYGTVYVVCFLSWFIMNI